MKSASQLSRLLLSFLCTGFFSVSGFPGTAQAMPVEARNDALQSVVQIVPYNWEAEEFYGRAGSGTVISALGHVLTNHHVLVDGGGAPIEVLPIFTTDAKAPTEAAQPKYLAVLVDTNAELDLSLLQIVADLQGNPLPQHHRFTYAPIGTIENLLLGDSIFVIGFPGVSGNTITFTGGVVSGFLGSDLTGSGDAWVKTDARMAPGNSGGGAFDAAGTLVGIPTLLVPGTAPGLHQELFRPIDYAYSMISQHVPNAALHVGARQPRQATGSPGELTKNQEGEIRSSLDMTDAQYIEGRNAHAYRLQVTQPGGARVNLKSAEFDAYLLLLSPSDTVVLEIDDSPGVGTNVAEDIQFEEVGAYTVIVTSALPREAGAYVLSVESAEGSGLEIAATELPRGSVSDHTTTYAGRWSGRIIDTAGGRGAVVAELTQTGSAIVEGTWEATFSWGTTAGTMMGLVQSEGLFVELYPNDRSACPFSGLAELDGYTIAGAYTAFDCSMPIAGSISLTKRQ